jgi:hypothetical protein
MRRAAAVLILLAGCSGRPELVDLATVNPRIYRDIRYATENNFTRQKVYDSAVCYLRPAVAEKLSRAQQELERSGLGLKVYDCYRPHSVQRRFWELMPDERYVADPAQGSHHNRGASRSPWWTRRAGNCPAERVRRLHRSRPPLQRGRLGGRQGEPRAVAARHGEERVSALAHRVVALRRQ